MNGLFRNRSLGLIACFFIAAWLPQALAEDTSAPVILQYFESSYQTIEERSADVFKAGYGIMFTPPPGRADTGNQSVGYDQYDRFDLGGPSNYTLYGSETGFKTVIKVIQTAGIDYYIDLVLNHDGYSDLTTVDGNGNTFYNAGGYPGMCITLPQAIDGDFHSAYATGDLDERLAGLIDIDHTTNFRFYRSPVPGIVAGANDGGNIRAGTVPCYGRIANVPDINNKRFYPDQTLNPILVYDPNTGEQNIPIYPFNLGNPMNGTPSPENVLGYLMRYTQYLVQTCNVDGYRLDAAKNFDSFVLNYYDRAVYRSSFRNLLNGQQRNIFAFSEAYDTNLPYLETFVVKTINPNNPGQIGGNRDTLDFALFFAMQGNLTGDGLTNDWHNIENASLDYYDDGLHNGSAGVTFVSSHDDFGPYLSNVAYAYTLMLPGNTIVYFNAHEFGDATARPFPKDGRGDALGGLYGNTITGLVDIRNRYGRGDYVERWLEKENFAYERSGSALVLLSNRVDSGYDSRTLLTNFAPGTNLIELTGNAASSTSNPFQDVPQLVVVNGDHTVNVRFLRNVAPGTNNFTGNGYLIYGLASPQGTLSLTNVASVLAGGTPTDATNGTVRVNNIDVITADSFQVKLQTIPVNLLGSVREKPADGDNALIRIDGGIDVNGNGHVDYTTPGTTSYGFEEFVTQHNPGYFDPNGNGTYVQTVDATKLSEGVHFITVRCYRHRDDGGPAIFTDFRQTIYVDRKKPVVALASFSPLVAGVNQNQQALIRSTDLTANNVHVLLDLPAALTDAQVIAMINNGTQSGQIDRDLFAYGFNNLTNGNHVITTVSFERTGNVGVQRFPGNYTSTLNGAGLGDLDFDGQYTPADIALFKTLLTSNNTQFNPAADLNGDGVIDSQDLALLGPALTAADASVATMTAYYNLVNSLSTFNNPPIANPDTVTTAENFSLGISTATLLANDSPGPGAEQAQTITVTGASSLSTHGGHVFLAGTTITYTPPANFNGTDTFTYTITDNGTSNGQPDPKSANGTVTVIVTATNQAPTANPDSLTTSENTPLTVSGNVLTANDSPGPANESGQTLTVTQVSAASTAGGTVVLSNGNITYTPAVNFNGTDTFTYTITDNGTTNGQPDYKTATGTVTVTVTEVNQSPVANPDGVITAEDRALMIPAAILLTIDSAGPPNESGQTLTIVFVSPTSAAGGTVALNGSTITYTPAATFNGTDTFTYTITDNGTTHGMPDPKTAMGTVTVTVTEVNHPPVAVGDSLAAALNTPAVFQASVLTANDSAGPANESGQTLTVTAVSSASANGGTVSLSNGTITYTPPNNFMGMDTFTYTVTDNGTTSGQPDPKSATGTVTVTVSSPNGNQPPVTNPITITTTENVATTVTAASLIANDTPGPANENSQTIAMTAAASASAQGGTVGLSNGMVMYTPPLNFSGSDSFTYTVTDNGTPPMSAAGTVFVTVTAVNQPPVANPDFLQTAEDVPLSVSVSVLVANDSPGPANESNQTLSVVSVSAASVQGGTVVLSGGIVTYTPGLHFNGSDTFTYVVTDNGTTNGTADPRTATGTVTVTVTAVNQPPIANTDTLQTNENTPVTVAASVLLANDLPGPTNESTQTLTVTSVTVPSMTSGTVVLDNGQITYTPPVNFSGTDTFAYTVTDNGTTGGSADPKSTTGTVVVTVLAVNQPPVANPDFLTTAENAALTVSSTVLISNDTPGPVEESDQTLTIVSVSAASAQGGMVVLNGGSITYTPPQYFNGMDTFTYVVTDDGTTAGVADPLTATGTVTVTVTEVNQPPTANPDTLSTLQNNALTFAASVLTANDSTGPANESAQTLTVTGVATVSAQGGTITFTDGQITYTPPNNVTGPDQFNYTIADNGTTGGISDPQSATGVVTVNIIPVNQPPTAFPDSVTAYQNETLQIPAATLLANDIAGPPSENAQTLTVTGVTAASALGGVVTLSGTTISYTPPLQFTGTDSFNYSITDNGTTQGAPDPKAATGTVMVTVLAKQHAPTISMVTATPSSVATNELVTFAVVTGNIDQVPLTIAWSFGDGTTGTGTPATHSYSSDGNFTAAVTVADNRGLSANSSTSVTVASQGASVTKLAIDLKLVAGKKPADSIGLTGTLGVPNGFVFAGAMVQFNIGGVMQAFALDSHGHAKNGTNTLTVATKPKNGVVKFTLALKSGSFEAALANVGLDNETIKNKAVQVPVDIQFNGHEFLVLENLKYTAKKNSVGKAQ